MQCFESVKPLLKLWRETIVRFSLVGEQRVTACGRRIEDVQERRARRLVLVCYVGMPGDGVGPRFEKRLSSVVISASMNEMDFWMALGSSTGWVDVQSSEVFTNLQCFADGQVGEVLVIEHCGGFVSWVLSPCTWRQD